MHWQETLEDMLPESLRAALRQCGAQTLERATELRARQEGAYLISEGRALRLCGMGKAGMSELVEGLTRGRMHMLGECLKQGYVPLEDGLRAGVCGRAIVRVGHIEGLEDISGVCIRLRRPLRGAAEGIKEHLLSGKRPRSALILSAPGLGKTTLLRDAARILSDAGLNVAVADERGELAGLRGELLPGADVMSMCSKAQALSMLVRTMRPDVLLTDELGAPGDAQAVADAVRCGTAVIASAHAVSPERALARAELGAVLRAGVFEHMIVIGGPRPGTNIRVYDGKGNAIC